jgi:glutathione S-transferase
MKLVGGLLSPYVRRTAVSLNIMGLPYEHEQVSVFQNPDAVGKYNPLVRVPALVLDDGEVLVESWAIVDALDDLGGADKRLTPASGAARRKVMKVTAVALGATDKAVWAVYEGRFHPPEKIHQPWIDHNDRQVVAGFGYLDGLAEKAGASGWLAGTPSISQADVTAVVGFTFAAKMRPQLGLSACAPNLARIAARCEALVAFAKSPIPA